MAVRVASGLWRRLRNQETQVWAIRSAQPRQLEPALRAALAELAALDAGWQSVPGLREGDRVGPSYVGEPVPVPGGWVVMVDFDSLPPPVRREGVQRFADRLQQAQTDDVELGPAPTIGRRYNAVLAMAPMARAVLRGADHRALVEPALSWLREQPGGPDPVALVGSAELPVSWAALPALVSEIIGVGGQVVALSSDFRRVQASVAVNATAVGGWALSAATASGDPAVVVGWLREQREMVRSVAAAVGWAGVIVERDGQAIFGTPFEPYDGPDPYPMWFQILTVAQLDALGGVPPGAVQLPDGRAELTVGEPEQWMPGHPDHDAVRAEARRLLAPTG